MIERKRLARTPLPLLLQSKLLTRTRKYIIVLQRFVGFLVPLFVSPIQDVLLIKVTDTYLKVLCALIMLMDAL